MSTEEPRTPLHLMRDLLQLAIDGQWSGQTNTKCHCHPEYTSSCPECHALEYPHGSFGRAEGEHTPECTRMALIKAARAYLEVENDLAEERGDEGIYVP